MIASNLRIKLPRHQMIKGRKWWQKALSAVFDWGFYWDQISGATKYLIIEKQILCTF